MQTYSIHDKMLLVSFLILVIAVPTSLIAQDVSIEDFRIPETKYQRLLGGLSGTWNKTDEESINNANGYSYYKNSNSMNSSDAQMSLNYITNNFNENNSFQLSRSMEMHQKAALIAINGIPIPQALPAIL